MSGCIEKKCYKKFIRAIRHIIVLMQDETNLVKFFGGTPSIRIADALALGKMRQMDMEVSEGRRKLVPLEKVLKKHKIKRSDL